MNTKVCDDVVMDTSRLGVNARVEVDEKSESYPSPKQGSRMPTSCDQSNQFPSRDSPLHFSFFIEHHQTHS